MSDFILISVQSHSRQSQHIQGIWRKTPCEETQPDCSKSSGESHLSLWLRRW